MKIRKAHMRACGQAVLRQRMEPQGFQIRVEAGAGIVPGARLRIARDTDERIVAVRTSLDREVGLTRHPNGRWMTIPKVDEVIVVVPSAQDPSSAEVFSFSPAVMLQAFDQALLDHQRRKPELSYKAPIFVALDDRRRGRSAEIIPGLKADAQWHATIPFASVPRPGNSPSEDRLSFVDRVKREFAELTGVDVSKVVVEFRILP